MNETVAYHMSKYIAYDHLTPKFQSYVAALSASTEPMSYVEAINNPRWVDAMKEEVRELQ